MNRIIGETFQKPWDVSDGFTQFIDCENALNEKKNSHHIFVRNITSLSIRAQRKALVCEKTQYTPREFPLFGLPAQWSWKVKGWEV